MVRPKTKRPGGQSDAANPEPMPTGDGETVLLDVINDLTARSETGREKYGTRLKTHNGRNALIDAYQEALDLCMYLKQCLMEQGADE